MAAVFLLYCAAITSAVQSLAAAKTPSYIEVCSRNDPQLDACVVKQGRAAIPHFIHGDPKFGIPVLDPLDIQKLSVRQGARQVGLTLTLTDCKLYGLHNAEFTNSRTDLIKRHVEWDFINKEGLHIVGPYVAAGQVLLLPITGSGQANITLKDLIITYKHDFELVKRKSGKEYMNITSSKLLFNVGAAHFQFENLFNGNKLLGDNMNDFLNENWREMIKEFGPEIGDALGEVFRRLLTSILGSVPYEQIYPDTPV